MHKDYLDSHKIKKSVCFLCKEHHNQLSQKEKQSKKEIDKRLKKMSDIMANVVGKDDYNSAKQFYDFVQEKIENEEKKKKTVLKKYSM